MFALDVRFDRIRRISLNVEITGSGPILSGTYCMDLSQSWEAQAEQWIKWARAPNDSYWRHHRDQFIRLLPAPGKRTVDVGCGEGRLTRHLKQLGHAVVGIDARGFIFAAAAAIKLDAGFIPIRKKGKLPYQTHEEEYELEYGTATVAVHVDALKPGSRVLLVDDLLATGGTAAAAAALVQKLGATILQISFLIELTFLSGRGKLQNYPIKSVVQY